MAAAASTEFAGYYFPNPFSAVVPQILFPYEIGFPTIIMKDETSKAIFYEYYKTIHLQLIYHFIDMYKRLPMAGINMIAVGSFAKYLHNPISRVAFEDFDFQIFINSNDGNYLNDEYRARITDGELTRIGSITEALVKEVADRINAINAPYFPNFEILAGIPPITRSDSKPPPVKISIRYHTETTERIIKIADFNYQRHSVFAYNLIGENVLSFYDGMMPMLDMGVQIPVPSTPGLSIMGLIRTLLPCAFYLEKLTLISIHPSDLDSKKVERDLVFWRPICDEFRRRKIDIGRPDKIVKPKTKSTRGGNSKKTMKLYHYKTIRKANTTRISKKSRIASQKNRTYKLTKRINKNSK